MGDTATIIQIVCGWYPAVQAIYLFGTFGTSAERPDSDLDVGILLPPEIAKSIRFHDFFMLISDLSIALGRETDLINLRRVPTVLQKEVIAADRRIYCAAPFAADEFEMLTLSNYQKLNQERAEIISDALAAGRFVGDE